MVTDPSAFPFRPAKGRRGGFVFPDPEDPDDVRCAHEDAVEDCTALIRELRDRLGAVSERLQRHEGSPSPPRVKLLQGAETLLREIRRSLGLLEDVADAVEGDA
ncbi:MAG: hypothetical protein HZB39_18565 [Planctomycetes bacterium]|nr:hypothetical protein [Planctomycetota bacterium]